MIRPEHPSVRDVRDALRDSFGKAGSMSAWARANRICKTTLSRMMSGKRPVSEKAAAAVGYFPVTAYMKDTEMTITSGDLATASADGFRDGVKHATETMNPVFAEVAAERLRQDEQWGGAKHDDGHESADWWEFILHQYQNVNAQTHRERLVKVAALAVAGIESFDRQAKADK